MAVPEGPTDKRYTGNGVTKIFTIPFLLLAATDLDVYIDGIEISSGFTITNVGNPTSTITFTVTPVDQADIYLQLNVPFERLNDYQENGDFLSSTVNRDFDRIWQALKQLFRWSTRSLRLGNFDVDGAGWYRAKGNGIRDLKDPVEAQDASTKIWTQRYVGDVIGGMTGNPNLASNVFYRGPDGLSYTVQDMSNPIDPSKGAALIGRATVNVVSVRALLSTALDTSQVVRTVSWHTGLNKGGAHYIWWPSAQKSLHDGGRFISPTVPYTSDVPQIDFMRGVGETQQNGSGCFVLIGGGRSSALTYGLRGDGVTDESALAQHFIDKNKGRAIVFDKGSRFLFAGVVLDGAAYDSTEIVFAGEHVLGVRPANKPANFMLAWVGLGIRDCNGVQLDYKGHGNRALQPDQEHAFNVRLAGITNFACPRFKAREIRGDAIYIGQKEHQTDSKTCDNLHFGIFDVENSDDDGRNGMSIIAGHNIDIDVFRTNKVGALVGGVRQPGGFDIEPNADFQTVKNVHIGKVEIRTAGNFGLQVIGQSRSVLGGNVSSITFDSYCIESTLMSENVLPVSFRNCSGVRAKGSCVMFRNGGFINCSTLGIDNVIDCEVDHSGSGGTYGARLAVEARVVDLTLDLKASNYDGSACQSVYVSRSNIKIRGRSGAAGTRALHLRRFLRVGVIQEDVTYEVDCPKAGTLGNYAVFNEPSDLMTFSGVRLVGGNLNGYPTHGNRVSLCGAGFRRLSVPEVNNYPTMPTEGTWFAGDVVSRDTPMLIAASNMTLLGWVRLTTGSSNILRVDWANMYVSHVAPAT